VDLFEQAPDAAKLANRGGVGAANNGTAQGAEPHHLRDPKTGSPGERADSILFAGRDANVEALGETDLGLPTKRHGGLRRWACEKR
jgi:hypothetical protein